MSRYKELCSYCFNQQELENADLELVGCPVYGPKASSYVEKDPLVIARKAVNKVLGKRKK